MAVANVAMPPVSGTAASVVRLRSALGLPSRLRLSCWDGLDFEPD
ncbi:hypothetical protein [Rhodopirellula halodulae]|nr:hypothetical protein [Rhodopirellula sp. JC737]